MGVQETHSEVVTTESLERKGRRCSGHDKRTKGPLDGDGLN